MYVIDNEDDNFFLLPVITEGCQECENDLAVLSVLFQLVPDVWQRFVRLGVLLTQAGRNWI